MTTESYIAKLARVYKDDGFTKEEMAKEMFGFGSSFEIVVKVGREMK